uniref:LytR/AlgR family response regulator transcription factor n=1 Tax=Agathobacter sp. TaxID=2021311 RepID=UPI0040574E0D
MYHIAICDDNKEFLDNIKEVIESSPECEPNTMFYRFRSGDDLLGSLVETYNLIILDMQMEKIDGFDTALGVRRRNTDAVLAFCSGAVMPQPEHFEVQTYHYLLKKVDGEKMQKNISELLMEMKRRRKNHVIEITGDGKAYGVNVNDIVYVERLGRGSSFVVQQNEKDAL